MKKLYIVIIALVMCATGIIVFFKFKNNSLTEMLKEAKSMNAYQLVCDMEMAQNDELKSYEVKVDYLKKEKQKYYRVELYDKSLNQSQIIIKNQKGVYVLTPTLNQMFKFQSDWPENSPKPYIYHYLLNILENNKVKKIEKGYVNEIIDTLGIRTKLENLPSALSGGQQQRVAIARALAAKPAILLADEPTGNLDSKTSQDVLGLLKVTSKRFHQTIVMITHNEEIAQMADRILQIEDGKIVSDSGLV